MGDHAEQKLRDNPDTGPQGTRVVRREEIDQYFADHGLKATRSGGAPSGAWLLGLNGGRENHRFDIPLGRSTVGRSPTNNIVVDADSVSLVHARILQKSGEWWVLNLLSTNGTYVNDRKITDSRIHDGDRIHFGDAEFTFRLPEPDNGTIRGGLSRLARKLRSLLAK